MVAQESVAAQCLVIGEDLGTVPEGFRDIMADWGIVVVSRDACSSAATTAPFIRPQRYPAQRAGRPSTPTICRPSPAGSPAMTSTSSTRIGVDPGEDRARARDTRRAPRRGARAPRPRSTAIIAFADVARFIARTPSRLLVIAAEDVLGVRRPAQRARHHRRASELAAQAAASISKTLPRTAACGRSATCSPPKGARPGEAVTARLIGPHARSGSAPRN